MKPVYYVFVYFMSQALVLFRQGEYISLLQTDWLHIFLYYYNASNFIMNTSLSVAVPNYLKVFTLPKVFICNCSVMVLQTNVKGRQYSLSRSLWYLIPY